MTESREQLLMSRLADGEAGDQDWRQLESLADADPTLWRHMAEMQRDHIALLNAMAPAASAAEAVAAPTFIASSIVSVPHHDHVRANRLGAWTGWAVAALVALVATIRTVAPAGTPMSANNPTLQQAGILGSATDAFNAYLKKGQETGEVVGEVPAKVLVESRPAANGKGFEVIFIRQVMERTVVPDLYQISGENELGQPMLARYVQPVRRSM